MSVYKGIFWYVPHEKRLITVKVKCDRNGVALENANYSSKSGENFNHKAEWAKFSKSITKSYPFNYYPRGRVEVKNGKVKIFMSPVLCRFDVFGLIMETFELNNDDVTIREIADNSKHYEYLTDFEPTICNMCGKTFDEWDYQENFCFDTHIGYGSRYDLNRLRLNLCIDCFDKVLDFILPQCKENPLSEYRFEGEIDA